MTRRKHAAFDNRHSTLIDSWDLLSSRPPLNRLAFDGTTFSADVCVRACAKVISRFWLVITLCVVLCSRIPFTIPFGISKNGKRITSAMSKVHWPYVSLVGTLQMHRRNRTKPSKFAEHTQWMSFTLYFHVEHASIKLQLILLRWRLHIDVCFLISQSPLNGIQTQFFDHT